MSFDSVDTVVVGAGLVGLAVARALAGAGREVIVLEANPGIGQETSSRNSEVIHAGIYYTPGSLKASACLQGRQMLYRYCEAKGIPHQRTGKLIVALNASQIEALSRLKINAASCGVNDLEWVDKQHLYDFEPAVRAEAALFSPSTGIIDSHSLMQSLHADLESAGGTVVTQCKVSSVEIVSKEFCLRAENGESFELRAKAVINAGGLHASEFATHINGFPKNHVPRTRLVKGHYFYYSGRSPFSHLVYPLPDAHGLGIHATHDQAGQLRFGPDAEYQAGIDYAFDESRKETFARSISKWYPGLEPNRLKPGYTGIRPRLAGPDEGFSDFVISGPRDHGIDGLVNLFGIESPGLTACLSLAELVRNKLYE